MPARRDARHGHRPGRCRGQGRRRAPLRRAGDAHPARRRRRGDAASSSAAASGSPPTSSCATPTCPSPTGRCSAASTRRGPPAAAATRRRACCGSPACAARPPADAAHHNIHFGGEWDDVVRRDHPRRRRMPDPSILVTLHSLDDADAGAGRLLDAVRPRAGAQPRRPRRLDAPSASAADGPPARAGRRRLGYPIDVVVEEIYDPLDWEALGHGAGHAVRPRPHVPPDRAVPARATSTGGCRGWCSSARRRCPASACRWCWSRASWPPASVRCDGSAADDRHARGELRRVPPAQQALRHHLLLVDDGAARRSSATTCTPCTRFCRYADDIVDDLGPGAGRRTRARGAGAFGDRFFADLGAGRSDDLVLKAVVHTVRAFDIDPDAFRRFLRSMTMDLTVDATRRTTTCASTWTARRR